MKAVRKAIERLEGEGCTVERSDVPGLYIVNGTELTTYHLVSLDPRKLPHPPEAT